MTSTAAELNLLDGGAAGTIVNSKAVVYGSSGEVNATTLQIAGTAITSSAAELNILDGVTSTAAELNILDGVTSTAAELNLLDGGAAGTIVNSKAVVYGSSGEVNATTLQIAGTSITSSAAELNILDGVTSTAAELNILDGVTSTTAELNILDGVTSTTAELNILDGVTSTTAELNILDGVTSTAAELNLLDGGVAGTVVNSKAVVYGSSGEVNATSYKISSQTFLQYIAGQGQDPQAFILGNSTNTVVALQASENVRLFSGSTEFWGSQDTNNYANFNEYSGGLEIKTGNGDDGDETKLRTLFTNTGISIIRQSSSDGSPVVLNLSSNEQQITAGETIGKIEFQASNSTFNDGNDSLDVAAQIDAISEGTFSSTNNPTKLSFKTASGGNAATEKMSLSSTGALTISSSLTLSSGSISDSGGSISFGSSDLTTSGTITSTSDIRLKKDIIEIENCVDKVKQIRGVNFKWKKDNREDFGVIAQEIEAVAPYAVKENDDGIKAVDYGKLTSVLIQAVKEQQATIENQQSQIDELKELVNKLGDSSQ